MFFQLFSQLYTEVLKSISLACAPSRDRTYDLILKRDLLYQLSYGRLVTKYIGNKAKNQEKI